MAGYSGKVTFNKCNNPLVSFLSPWPSDVGTSPSFRLSCAAVSRTSSPNIYLNSHCLDVCVANPHNEQVYDLFFPFTVPISYHELRRFEASFGRRPRGGENATGILVFKQSCTSCFNFSSTKSTSAWSGRGKLIPAYCAHHAVVKFRL